MDKNIDEVWYSPAYQTEVGRKNLQRKVAEGKRIFVHLHDANGDCEPLASSKPPCKVVKEGEI